MRGFLLALIVAAAGCGGSGANIDREGCMYLEGGPFTPITAGTMRDATAPAIAADARAYTVTLPAAAAGYLSFDSPDDTEYAVFLDRDVPLAVSDAAGAPMAFAAIATSSGDCATIHGRYIVELPIGPFFFAVGPDAGGPVNLVLRPYNPD